MSANKHCVLRFTLAAWEIPPGQRTLPDESAVESRGRSLVVMGKCRRILESKPGPSILYEYRAVEFGEDNSTGMKIYFGFTVAGDRSGVIVARKIVGILEEMRHEVLTRHLVEENAWETDRSIPPKEVYLRDMKWIEQCDMFIAEVSGSSFGLGFETGYLLGATTKKVVLFYRRDVESKISLLITGNSHPNCRLVPYSELNEVELWIRNNLPQ